MCVGNAMGNLPVFACLAIRPSCSVCRTGVAEETVIGLILSDVPAANSLQANEGACPGLPARPSKSLRLTPELAAGVSDRLWTLREFVEQASRQNRMKPESTITALCLPEPHTGLPGFCGGVWRRFCPIA